jgi:hypothetical protein
MRQEARQMLLRLSNVMPFLMLFLLKYLYQHAVGIVFALAYTALIIYLDRKFKAQVAMKADQDPVLLAAVGLASLLAILVLYSFLVYLGDTRAYTRLFFAPLPEPPRDGLGIDTVLWAILVSDVVVRLAFMSLKAWLALVPLPTPKRRPLGARNGEHPAEEGLGLLQDLEANRGSPHPHPQPIAGMSVNTRKRRLYAILEMISLVYRTMLPVPLWIQYYQVRARR